MLELADIKPIYFSCVIKEEMKESGEVKKVLNGLPYNWTSLKKTKINAKDNCKCMKLGQVNKDTALLMIDFDNKPSTADYYDGMELFRDWKQTNIIDESNDYIETTANGGIHLVYLINTALFKQIKCACNDLFIGGNRFKVDIKCRNQFMICDGTKFKTFDGKETKSYKAINKTFTMIPKQIETILLNQEHLVSTPKKVKGKTIVKQTHTNTTLPFNDKGTSIEILEKIVKLIKPQDYHFWILIGMALKNENKNSLNIWQDWSKYGPYIDTCVQECFDKWNRFKSNTNIDSVGIGTLKYYAKKDNPEEYFKLFNSNSLALETELKNNPNMVSIEKSKICNSMYLFSNFKKIIKHDENDEKISETINKWIYENHKCLCIKSEMDTGKTYLITELLKNYSAKFKRVLFVTHRTKFANDIYEKFKSMGFIHYQKDPDKMMFGDKIICQIESLHKLFAFNNSPFDLIIMDEIESVLNQFSSPTMKGTNYDILYKFTEMEKLANKLLYFDADFALRAYQYINNNIQKDPLFIINKFTKCKRSITCYPTKKIVYNDIYTKLNENKNIAIISMSNKVGQKIYTNIIAKFPDKKILLMTSKTCSDDKVKEKLDNVNTYWIDYDVIIYTSAIDAGISFNKKHFDSLYIFACNNCNGPRSLIQQTGRIRNLENDNIMTYVNPAQFNTKINNYYCYTFDEVYKYMMETTATYSSYHNPNIINVLAWNELEKLNKSRSSFLTILNRCCNNAHIKLDIKNLQLTSENKEEMKIERKQDKIENKKEKEKDKQEFLVLPIISVEQAETIELKMANKTNTDLEAKILDKYRYMQEWKLDTITEETYNIIVGNESKIKNLIELIKYNENNKVSDDPEQIKSWERIKFIKMIQTYTHLTKIFKNNTITKEKFQNYAIKIIEHIKTIDKSKLNIVFNFDKNKKHLEKFGSLDKTNKYLNNFLKEYCLKITRVRTGKTGKYSNFAIKITNKEIETIIKKFIEQ